MGRATAKVELLHEGSFDEKIIQSQELDSPKASGIAAFSLERRMLRSIFIKACLIRRKILR